MARARDAVRSLVDRVCRPRPALRPAASSAHAASAQPRLSVVIPAYDVEPYLDEALTSLRAQTLTDLEVVVVDDGSTDRTVEVARAHAAADPRIRVVTQPNAGQGAARNHGTRLARGRFLTFMDADDVLPPRAYALMVGALEDSGSDFCLGAVRRFDGTRSWRAAWVHESHREELRGVTIEEHPASMKDIIACNRVYRREFWDRQIGGFPEGVAYEDHLPNLTAFLDDARFDVLTDDTYLWRVRADRSSTTNKKAELQNLLDRATAKRDAWELLTTRASEPVRRAWLARVIDLDLTGYYAHGVDADADYRSVLQEFVTTYWDKLDAADLQRVRVRPKLLAWAIARGAWDDLAALVTAFADGLAGSVVADAHHPHLPEDAVRPLVSADVPAALLRLGLAEGRPVLRATAPRWTRTGALELTVRAEVARQEIPGARVRLTLVDADGAVWTTEVDPGKVEVPVAAELATISAARPVEPWVRLSASVVTDRGVVAADLAGLGAVRPTALVHHGDGLAVLPRVSVQALELRAAPEALVLRGVTLEPTLVRIELAGTEIAGTELAGVQGAELRWRDRDARRTAAAPPAGATTTGTATTPATGTIVWPLDAFGGSGTWRLEGRSSGGKFRAVRAPAGFEPTHLPGLALTTTAAGALRLSVGPDAGAPPR